jgi:hypothetical protein
MSTEFSAKRGREEIWPASLIWSLDRWLRTRQGVYEYTADAECLFRIQRARAERAFSLSDGTQVRAGEPILTLHFWNEHIPAMGRRPTLVWARRTLNALDHSLQGLADYLRARAEYNDVAAFFGDMCLGTAAQCEQLARIVARYGFERAYRCEARNQAFLHPLGQSILVLLLALVTNRATLRTAILRRHRECLVLSRAMLECRYGALRRQPRTHPAGSLSVMRPV